MSGTQSLRPNLTEICQNVHNFNNGLLVLAEQTLYNLRENSLVFINFKTSYGEDKVAKHKKKKQNKKTQISIWLAYNYLLLFFFFLIVCLLLVDIAHVLSYSFPNDDNDESFIPFEHVSVSRFGPISRMSKIRTYNSAPVQVTAEVSTETQCIHTGLFWLTWRFLYKRLNSLLWKARFTREKKKF